MRPSPGHSADFSSRLELDPALPSRPCLSQPHAAHGQRPSKVDKHKGSKLTKGFTLSQSTTRFLSPDVRSFGEHKVSSVSVDRSFEIPDTKSVYTSISETGKRQEASPRKKVFVSVCFGLSETRKHREEYSDSESDHAPGPQVYNSPLGSEDVRNQTKSRNDTDAVQMSNTLPLDAPGKDVTSQQPRQPSLHQRHKIGKARHLTKTKTRHKGSDTGSNDSSEYTPDKKKRKKRSIAHARVSSHCTFCDMFFERAADYVRHCQSIRHQQAVGCDVSKQTVCDGCGLTFTRLDALKRHQRKTCLLEGSTGSGILSEEGIPYRDKKMPSRSRYSLKTEMDEPTI